MWYSKLNNKRLWKIFSDISAIPRESGNEAGIRAYLLAWAKENGIEASSDDRGNVYMKKGGTEGLESLPPVALQAHMDMVCVKTPESDHDFTKDPIKIATDGTKVFAEGTSLGADDGLGVAIILDILSDPDAEHGPLEAILTVEEETGLGGAYGIDPEKTVFFRQSDVPEVCELTWILNCITGLGLLERAHSYKDKIAKGFQPNNGLFSYPVLMASDILIYRSDLVPVGKDQKQHLEMTRDIAIKFNQTYGETFVIPDEKISESVSVIPGLDGQKMSKSYNNTIEIFGEEKAMRKKFMSIKTDSKSVEEVKDPDTSSIFQLYRLFATPDQVEEMRRN